MNFQKALIATGIGLVSAAFVGPKLVNSDPAIAQRNCTPLEVVGAFETNIEKTVSPPSTGITQSNWNTDFVVSDNYDADRFFARIVAEDAGEYDIEVYLKYPDDTADEVFNEEAVDLEAGESIIIPAYPRVSQDPYQVNVEVGGIQALGHTYWVSVEGCQ
jgi:hypothetical protein